MLRRSRSLRLTDTVVESSSRNLRDYFSIAIAKYAQGQHTMMDVTSAGRIQRQRLLS